MNENVNFKLRYTQEDQTTASIYFEVQKFEGPSENTNSKRLYKV